MKHPRQTRSWNRFCAAGWLALFPVLALHSQAPQPDSPDASAPVAPTISIHGVVMNAATGEPLPRVLVSLRSQFGKGALTDGDGRFEIQGVNAESTVPIDLTKPGYENAPGPAGGAAMWADNSGMPHVITVTADMPDLQFAMRPLNAIRGQIELSTGEPGVGFRVELLRQTVLEGRLQWRVAANTPTNADGNFRFGGLSDGVYALDVQPSIDGDVGRLLELDVKPAPVRTGYALTFYPNAHDLAGAARIPVSAGQTVQANLMLRQEQFHLVQALVSGPHADSPAGGGPQQSRVMNSNAGMAIAFLGSDMDPEVLDVHGHELPYRAEYDAKSHTVQALLPDGDYTLFVAGLQPSKSVGNSGGFAFLSHSFRAQDFLLGQAGVSVRSHAVSGVRIALGPESSNELDVIVNRTGSEPPQPPPQQNGSGPGIFVSASLAGSDVTDPMSAQFSQGSIPGALETQPLAPGSYWLHTAAAQAGLCESSFTAGGANLAREPLVVAANGSTAPLTLTLRDDCASLRISLPEQLAVSAAGEAPMYWVYVIPDFDSTTEIRPQVLRPSSLNSTTFEHLSPGAYRVYTLRSSVDLPFRDSGAMAALNLHGQEVTLDPGASTDLVLEVSAP